MTGPVERRRGIALIGFWLAVVFQLGTATVVAEVRFYPPHHLDWAHIAAALAVTLAVQAGALAYRRVTRAAYLKESADPEAMGSYTNTAYYLQTVLPR